MSDDARAALAAAGDRWRAAVSDERAAAVACYAAIVEACDAGVSEREAARLAGVDRLTVRRARGKGK